MGIISQSHTSRRCSICCRWCCPAVVEEKKDQTNPRKGRGVKKPVPDKRDISPRTEGRLREIQLALPPRQSPCFPLAAALACGRAKFWAYLLMTSTGNS